MFFGYFFIILCGNYFFKRDYDEELQTQYSIINNYTT